MPTYNKLVRDRIPEIIQNNDEKCSTRILSDEEYITELKNKSFEELNEYMEATNNADALEELADLLEIIHALALCHGADIDELEMIRKDKADKRGGFDDRVFLIEVED